MSFGTTPKPVMSFGATTHKWVSKSPVTVNQSVPCPECGAKIGRQCTTTSTHIPYQKKPLKRTVHFARKLVRIKDVINQKEKRHAE